MSHLTDDMQLRTPHYIFTAYLFLKMRTTPFFMIFLVDVHSRAWRLKKNMFDMDYFDKDSLTENVTVATPGFPETIRTIKPTTVPSH